LNYLGLSDLVTYQYWIKQNRNMAEILGVVSSGFAVVSLALQLVEVAQKIHTF
jgi:hypothetical protein